MSHRVEHIGDAVLLLGDCRELLPTFGRVDCLLTSPPYNCGKKYGDYSDDLSIDEYTDLLRRTITNRARVSVINVGQYVGSREARLSLPALVESVMGSPPVDEVLWDKGPANGAAWGNYPNSPRIRAQHESILVFGNARMPTGNGLSWAEWSALTTSIWRVSANVNLSIHPAMMPLEIAVRCVSLWSDINGEVLDPFMGSGTSGVACAKLGRKFIGIEQSPEYFDAACRRIEKAHAQGDLFTVPA